MSLDHNIWRSFDISAPAIILWFIFTGVIGLSLFFLHEFQFLLKIAKNIFSSVYILRIVQAWLVILIAHFSYGTLMTHSYFIIVAVVFTSVYQLKKRVNGG